MRSRSPIVVPYHRITLVVATLTRGIPLPLGVVGHQGSTVIVVLDGLRLLRTRAGTS